MQKQIEMFKALSDKNRLLILDMLSCGELCACDVMEGLKLTQPTISHHMKILQHAGLVKGRKSGKWVIYSICQDTVDEVVDYVKHLTSEKEECICKHVVSSCDKDK